jgi:glycosyltransferase involved in cell wall biosynthesis
MASSISILHIVRSYSWGGLEIYVTQFIKQLSKTEIPQAVLCIEGSMIHKELLELNIPIYTSQTNSKFSRKDINTLISLSNKYSIFHSHTKRDVWPSSLAILLGAKSKHVFSLYMGVTDKRNFWHKIIYGKVDAIVSSSEKINSEIEKYYPIEKSKIHLVRYGRDSNLYVSDTEKRIQTRKLYGATDDTIVLGTLARIDEGKGIIELAESALYLPENLKSLVQIWIIGDRSISGKDKQGKPIFDRKSEQLYEQLIIFIESNNLGSIVKLIGFQKDYIAYLAAMDIFTLLSWNEMYSLSVIDAMFMKLPTIGTDAGGTPEQIGEGRGLLVPIKSPTQVAQKLTQLAGDAELRQTLGQKSKDWANDQHNWENVIQRFKNLYADIRKSKN